MAGFNPEFITGTLTQAPSSGSGVAPTSGAGGVQSHHALVGIVLLAVLVLFLLDRAGFRFAITVGPG